MPGEQVVVTISYLQALDYANGAHLTGPPSLAATHCSCRSASARLSGSGEISAFYALAAASKKCRSSAATTSGLFRGMKCPESTTMTLD
jgi:hypothetical protein